MEAIIAQAIKDTAVLRKTEVPWEADKPHAQGYYAFDSATSSWVPKSPAANENGTQPQKSQEVTNLALYTWNVDFMLPFPEARMKPALAHLDTLTKPLPPTTASVIYLQECTPGDLITIANTPWVRERYHLLDVDPTNWATTHYGTTTLVDARLPIVSAFRVHYSKTRMDRDAFFVDILLRSKTVRLCNTHLESMAFDPPFRPPQVELVARYMHEGHLHAALAAGDFNAIQPFDRTLHKDGNNDLRDAYLELGGEEDSDQGFTWGQQAATKLREQFGCSRMDKVYFCGNVKLVKFERFGGDILAEGEEERKQIVELGFEKPWVTDHLGVVAEVQVTDSQDVPVSQL